MKKVNFNYNYSPFNVFSVVVFMFYFAFILKNLEDIKNIFDESLLIPLLCIIIWLIDYYFQHNNYNFKYLLFFESIIMIFVISYFIYGIANAF